jgi:hypothetical protein
MVTQQPKGQLQSEHEWKKETHTKYKNEAIYNIWVMIRNNTDKNQSYQLEVIIQIMIITIVRTNLCLAQRYERRALEPAEYE